MTEEQKIQATTADQLAQEDKMQVGGGDRARKRRENLRDRAGLSTTDAGASLKDEVLMDVADAIEGFLLEVENRSGGPEAGGGGCGPGWERRGRGGGTS